MRLGRQKISDSFWRHHRLLSGLVTTVLRNAGLQGVLREEEGERAEGEEETFWSQAAFPQQHESQAKAPERLPRSDTISSLSLATPSCGNGAGLDSSLKLRGFKS